MMDEIPLNLHPLAQKLNSHLEIEENPRLQFCPMKFWKRPVDIGNSLTNDPRGVTWEWSHSFCILCNNPKHEGKGCDEAKGFWMFYDNPKTRRCPKCRNVLQIWNMVDKLNPEWEICDTRLEPQKEVHLSTLSYILWYIFMIFQLPGYLAKKVFFYLRDKWVKGGNGENNISESEVWLIYTAIVFIVIWVFLIVIIFGPIFWVIGYIKVIHMNYQQRKEEARLREEFRLKDNEIGGLTSIDP